MYVNLVAIGVVVDRYVALEIVTLIHKDATLGCALVWVTVRINSSTLASLTR